MGRRVEGLGCYCQGFSTDLQRMICLPLGRNDPSGLLLSSRVLTGILMVTIRLTLDSAHQTQVLLCRITLQTDRKATWVRFCTLSWHIAVQWNLLISNRGKSGGQNELAFCTNLMAWFQHHHHEVGSALQKKRKEKKGNTPPQDISQRVELKRKNQPTQGRQWLLCFSLSNTWCVSLAL